MKKMNIGFDAKRVFQNYSGLGNYSRNTISLLARYYPENSYKLFSPKLTKLYSLPESAEVITPKSYFSRYFRSYWRLHQTTKLIANNKIDVFHGLSHVLPYGIEKTGIPTVVTVHDLIFLRFPEFYKSIDRKIYCSIYKSSCQRATKIIAISNQTKDDLIHFFGINPEKIVVVYQSCNNLFYEEVDKIVKFRVRLQFNLPQCFILCVGTIEKRKNQLAILKAMREIKCEIPIVILGRATEYIHELKDFLDKSDFYSEVIFLHKTTTEELMAIYQMAELMVYPSLFEGFGLPIIEAQASRCPVITSNISSLPEAAGLGALYVDPENIVELGAAILNVLSDEHLKNELITKGLSNSSRFSDKYVAEQLIDLYSSIRLK